MSSIWTVRRSATDAKAAGLCAGLARMWNVDPTIIRVGFAILALSGVGLVLYLAGWLLVPVEGRDDAPITDLLGPQARSWPREAWVAVVAVACVAAMAFFGSVLQFSIGPVLILAAIWYFGYYRTHRGQQSESAQTADGGVIGPAFTAPPVPVVSPYSGPPTPFTAAADTWRERVAEVQGVPAPGPRAVAPPALAPVALAAPLAVRPDPRVAAVGLETQGSSPSLDQITYFAHPDPVGLFEPVPAAQTVVSSPALRRTSTAARRLRLATLAIAGLILAGLAIAARAGVSVPMAAYPAAALLVVGIALVISAWLGRARGLLPAALLLAAAVAAASVVGPLADRNWTATTRAYSTTSALPVAGDRLESGLLEVDLRQLPVTRDTTYTAAVDLGSVEVRVPPTVNVRVEYAVDRGLVTAFDKDFAGGQVNGVVESPGFRSGQPTLTVRVSADRGHVGVSR